MKNKILSLAVTLTLVGILLSHVNLSEFISTLGSIQLEFIALGFFLYLFSQILRAARFTMLLKGKIKWKDMFPITCIHYMVNNILPMRTGELSYIYLIKKLHRIPVTEGMATLGIARVFDFISIVILFLISYFFTKDIPSAIGTIFSLIVGTLFLVLLIFIILLLWGEGFLSVAESLFKNIGFMNSSRIRFLLKKARETVGFFNIIRSKSIIIISMVESLLIWFSLYLVIYFILLGMGINLGLWKAILGSTLSVFTNIFPIPSIGNLGVYESVWAASFILLGISKEEAIASGFGIHLILLLYIGVLALFGFWRLGFNLFEFRK